MCEATFVDLNLRSQLAANVIGLAIDHSWLTPRDSYCTVFDAMVDLAGALRIDRPWNNETNLTMATHKYPFQKERPSGKDSNPLAFGNEGVLASNPLTAAPDGGLRHD